MRKRRLHIGIMLAALLVGSGVAAQPSEAVSTQGRDFWLVFLLNIADNSARHSVIIASEWGATVTVEAPRDGWSTTVEVPAGGSTEVLLGGANIGYHVTSTSDIAVYASNYLGTSFDIATVFPTPTLRSHYMVQTYADEGQLEACSEIGVVAVEDSTAVTLRTASGMMRNFTLMAGETQLFGNSDEFGGANRISGFLTGTTVEAAGGKRLAVFQGNMCTTVGASACDHLYEQAVPTDYWGKEFIVVPIAGRVSDDVVKITSLEDYCRVAVNDTFACLLDAGESHLMSRRDVFKISAMKPVTVCMYMSGDADTTHWGSETLFMGDPSAVIIPPVEQCLQHTVLHAFSTALSNSHYANVVVQGCAADSMQLDGEPIGTSFTAFDDEYSYAQLSLTPGVHTLSNNMGLFQAWFYGMGPYESYAYIAGMAMADYRQTLYVDSVEVTGDVHLCMGDSAWVELKTGGFMDTRWRLDGETLESTALRLPLHFDRAGTHTLRAMLHGDCCHQWCDSLEVTLVVHPSYHFAEEARFCEGTPYPWRDTVLLTAGSYSNSMTTSRGCDSLFTLQLEAKSVPTPGIDVEADCFSHTYRLTAQHLDTLEWSRMRWCTLPDVPGLHGHESDIVIELSPSTSTRVTLHAETECATDSVVVLEPIVWPVAEIYVTPEQLLLGRQTAFDAYDRSRDARGREWEVDGVPLGNVGNPLHYTVTDITDSVVVVLTAVNDYCRDTARAVVHVYNEGIYAPNIFTPREESNRRFTVVAAEGIEGELSIYNREGLLVFSTKDLTEGWDGNGYPQGAYVWHLRYRQAHLSNRWNKAVGTVTLIR